MEWSNEKVIAFLKILHTEPCLWNPILKSFKNRTAQNNAWRRVTQLLPFKATTEQIKKKKESLMGYYRIHLNKYKKSLKSSVGKDDVYTTNWFAFETMDGFLRGVYERNSTSSTEINDCSEPQVKSEGENDANENRTYLSPDIEETSQNISIENIYLPIESKSPRDCAIQRLPRDVLLPEIGAARRQMDEAYENMEEQNCDEYETFGKLIASKIKKIRNPNTRDMLMNNIHNLVCRTCMEDRIEQPAVP